MNSPKLGERCPSSLSNGCKLHSSDKTDSLDSSTLRECAKSERGGGGGGGGGGKGEEECRRRGRTIIVEKKNGSYGFTLQSYGIHYKKEQEIEVITYVDQVEAEGAAGQAGMRGGDVILSINGADVERADHAAIVEAIGACDARMRMVVIFEDCVRKVELHLKYINIQRALQQKMRALQQLAARERQLLDHGSGWTTHSLPSQKKKSVGVEPASDAEDAPAATGRPALSSENVTAKPPPHDALMYQYLEAHAHAHARYGTCVIRPDVRAGGFVITVGSPRARRDTHHYVLKSAADPAAAAACHRGGGGGGDAYKPSGKHRSGHGHSCTQCVPNPSNQDAASLEAYDLASPCCDPHCVPNARKKTRRKKDCSKEHKRKDKSQQMDKSTQKHDNCSHTRSKKSCEGVQCAGRYRYLTSESTQTSQCSLQSYAAGAVAAAVASAGAGGDTSASSYTTSLSSDTLFWETDRSECKSSPKIQYQSAHNHMKPKSWDNLTTKAFGGYGFGYGYLDTARQASRSRSHGRGHGGRSSAQSHLDHHQPHHTDKHHRPAGHHCGGGAGGGGHARCASAKSTESLVAANKYSLEGGGGGGGSESRLGCACDSQDYCRRAGGGGGAQYYTQHFIYPTHVYKKKDPNVSSEITRL